MSRLPSSVRFLESAASSAAKARGVNPALPTIDPFDVATALKCIVAFQTRVDRETLELLDDESNAQPLIAAARILQSTAQHLRQVESPADTVAIDELSFHAALAFAMQGNFPSARAALSDVPEHFLQKNLVFRMVAAICDPSSEIALTPSDDHMFGEFRAWWFRALRHPSEGIRGIAFRNTLNLLSLAARAGTKAEFALLLGGRMAAYQAGRLATINLLTVTPEIPRWFVLNSIKSGMATLLPPQYILLNKKRIAKHGRNTLLTLPTSTGKTFIAEACIAAELKYGGLCIYVAPYVAIGEQVKDSLRRRLGGEVSVVSMFGGFQSEALSGSSKSEVVVATPERFDGWLRVGEGLERLRTIIFDEIHILENGVRGTRVEGLISRLRLLQQSNSDLRIIGLSAVLTEPGRVCTWLGVKELDLHQIGWRPTARRLAVCRANGEMQWIHGSDALRPTGEKPITALTEPVRIHLPGQIQPARFANANEKSAAANVGAIARDFLFRLGAPGLIVCLRKLDTRLLASNLLQNREPIVNVKVLQTASSIVSRYPYLGFLAECLRHGISYHNASLPFDVRRDIEELIRGRALSFVCSTTTLAEGADLPFRWTIVAHWLSSMSEDGKPMKSMTFRNIAGRCGRAGAFSEGDTVLFENLMGPPSLLKPWQRDRRSLEEVMFASSPLVSTLGGEWDKTSPQGQRLLEATMSAQLLACIGEHPNADDIVLALTEASYAGQTDGKQNIQRILSETVNKILDDQQAGGAMAVMNSPIRLTEFGRAANLTGFSPDTCRLMMKFLFNESFETDAALYRELLERFHNIPEQSNEILRKIFSGVRHKNVIKADNIEEMIRGFLLRMDWRQIFENLRSKKSKAQPDTIETQFEEFVSFSNAVIGSFLPWMLRGLGKLSHFGGESAINTNWPLMAREVEASLHATGGDAEIDYVPPSTE